MACEDIPSLLGLQNTKKNIDDLGRLMGTGTGTSTNEVTGQVRPTYNAVMANLGYTRVGTFASGATLTTGRQTLLWDIADGGDGQEYGWSGTFPLSGKVVLPGSTPLTTGGIAVGAWMSRFDPVLRTQVFEALRRSYAEAGYNLVDGSFEAGATLTSATSVALYKTNGKAYSHAGPYPYAVAADTDPTAGGSGFVDESGAMLANYVAKANTVTTLMSLNIPTEISRLKTVGYYYIFGADDTWVRDTSITGLPASSSPVSLQLPGFTDAAGAFFRLLINNKIYIDSLGAKGGDIAYDSWPALELAFKNAEQNGVVVTAIGPQYLFNKPMLLKSGRHFEVDTNLGMTLRYGGGFLSATDAPNASTPIGSGTSIFSDKNAQVVISHTNGQYTQFCSLKGVYYVNAGGAQSAYNVYAPFATNVQWEDTRHVGGNIAWDSRNIYTSSATNCAFSPVSGVMGTVGLSITPIVNGIGAGTSLTFDRVGFTNYKFSYFVKELAYSTFTSCFSEGALTRYIGSFTDCLGLEFISYGCENLTAVAGDGRLFAIVNSNIEIDVKATYNINLSGTSAFSVTGNSKVIIKNPLINAVAAGYAPFITDNAAEVVVINPDLRGAAAGVNSIGIKTTIINPVGAAASYISGAWDGGFAQIGTGRVWDNAGQLRVKYGSDPTSATDGAPL